ncbi:MAG TPA: hypothetical protein VGI06_17915 [Acidimicrobiales bacterium]|jgi:hypothetical protein
MSDADDLRAPEPTWGPYPGDRLAPPPTPAAPEIEMSATWPWVAAAGLVLRILLPVIVVLAVIAGLVGLLAHWW